MGKDELIDIYDGTGKHLGEKSRLQAHRDGDWHKSLHCWVIYKDKNLREYIVLQKRSDNKSSWPGYVDITAAGHYLAGETTEEGIRELEEEIGVKANVDQLIPLGTRVCVEEFDESKINHEFQDIFFLIDNRDISQYKLQGEELAGLMKVEIDKLLDLFSKKIDEISVEGLQFERNGEELVLVPNNFVITREKFIPTLDNYNYKVMILAKRALSKEEHLLI